MDVLEPDGLTVFQNQKDPTHGPTGDVRMLICSVLQDPKLLRELTQPR